MMADKSARRSQGDILKLRGALVDIVEQHRPLTVRHLFYLAVAAGLIKKTEAEYKNVIIRLAGEMREDWLRAHDNSTATYEFVKRFFGDKTDYLEQSEILWKYTIPFGDSHIVDAGRWIHKPRTHSSVESALQDTARFYRRALWLNLPVQVHVFCEKDAIADLVFQETAVYDVPLAVMRGDSSKTFLWECAAAIEEAGKPAILYFLGDYDDKGRDIIRSAAERIERYAPKADISWEVLAITQEQIEEYNLPTRPEKKDASRAAVELDALPPDTLRGLIRAAIAQHLPIQELKVLLAAEKSERDLMQRIAGELPKVAQLLDDMDHGS
jgi:hypothetical protein